MSNAPTDTQASQHNFIQSRRFHALYKGRNIFTACAVSRVQRLFIRCSLTAVLLLLVLAFPRAGWSQFAQKEITQWAPFAEWQTSASSWPGNPYDVVEIGRASCRESRE